MSTAELGLRAPVGTRSGLPVLREPPVKSERHRVGKPIGAPLGDKHGNKSIPSGGRDSVEGGPVTV